MYFVNLLHLVHDMQPTAPPVWMTCTQLYVCMYACMYVRFVLYSLTHAPPVWMTCTQFIFSKKNSYIKGKSQLVHHMLGVKTFSWADSEIESSNYLCVRGKNKGPGWCQTCTRHTHTHTQTLKLYLYIYISLSLTHISISLSLTHTYFTHTQTHPNTQPTKHNQTHTNTHTQNTHTSTQKDAP